MPPHTGAPANHSTKLPAIMSTYTRLRSVISSALLAVSRLSPDWRRGAIVSILSLLVCGAAQAELPPEKIREILGKSGFTSAPSEIRPLVNDGELQNKDAELKASKAAAAAANKAATTLEEKLLGQGWGAGLAVLQLSGARPVESASVDSGNVVRITTKSKSRVGPVLEYHFPFSSLPGFFSGTGPAETLEKRVAAGQTAADLQWKAYKEGKTSPSELAEMIRVNLHRSLGLMAMAELGENTVRSLGLGFMFSLQHYSINAADSEAKRKGLPFNLGVVAFVEPNVKRVQGGYTDGQVVAAGTTMRLEEEGRHGFAIIFSSRF